MENYKEKYEHGVECIQEILSGAGDLIRTSTLRKRLQPFFPELKEKENEDEQMIERLKSCVYASDITPEGREEILAWLEKQGKKEYALKSFRDKDVDKFMQYIEKQAKAYEFNLPNRGYDISAFAKDILIWLEKQDKKKSIFNADDWYVSKVDGKIHNPKFIEKQGENKPAEDEKIKQEIVAYINELADLKNEKIPTKWLVWLEKQDQVKESHVSQHENKTCEENNEFLTNEDERIKETLKGFVKGYSAFINGQWRLGDFTVNRLIDWLEEQSKKKSADEVLKIRQELYQSGYNDGYKHGYNHGQNNIAIALGKESIDALEHFVRGIGESGYASPYDNRTKLVSKLLEQLKQIVI